MFKFTDVSKTDTYKRILTDMLPAMMSQSEVEDPIVKVIFTQVNGWKYFLYEYDPEQNIAFGYVMWDYSEFWSVSMDEQMEVANTYWHQIDFLTWEVKLSEVSDFKS